MQSATEFNDITQICCAVLDVFFPQSSVDTMTLAVFNVDLSLVETALAGHSEQAHHFARGMLQRPGHVGTVGHVSSPAAQ